MAKIGDVCLELVIPEYQSNANFLIDMNRMLIAVEAETVRFDDQSFYAYHSKS
ncbi:hypothetical protein JR311_19245 [Bacillus velezensis]|nr:hypothetical protein JR311_19245 [Bacillus velezensis]